MTLQSDIKTSFDPYEIRKEFPILKREINGKPLVYLDNAASAQKPDAVIEAVADVWRHSYANVHRGLHTLANEATAAYEGAREKLAHFINASRAEEIVFTKGTTDAINLVASSFGQMIEAGDEIILSQMEHHSNIVPWHFLRERKGAVIKWVKVTDEGALDIDHYKSLFSDRTKIVSLVHMSNVLGTVNDGQTLTRIAHEHGVPILLDGSQSAVHMAVDVQEIGCDFFTLTGHKLYGPNGVGALYAAGDWLDRLAPYQGGGEMIAEVSEEGVVYSDAPHKFEAGTPAIADVIGLGAAIDWLTSQDRLAILEHERTLMDQAVRELSVIEGLTIYGTVQNKGAVISFDVEGIHAHDLAQLMDKSGVAVRAGHHCAHPLMKRYGVSATVRASFAAYNTSEDVTGFIEALTKAMRILS